MRPLKHQHLDAVATPESFPEDSGVVLDDEAVHASLEAGIEADHDGDPIVGIFYAAAGGAVLWAMLFGAIRLLG
jgi:hypothetical protein